MYQWGHCVTCWTGDSDVKGEVLGETNIGGGISI